ncbi:MAG: hypothetical protein ACH350_03025 [Parachlamydiaceae bacterium]
MITIKNIKALDGQITNLTIETPLDKKIEGEGRLTLLPALINPHLSLGNPKSDEWKCGLESLVQGGFSTVLDIPSYDSPSSSKEELVSKKQQVDQQLIDLKIPFHYYPYAKTNSKYVEDLGAQKSLILGSLIQFHQEENGLNDQDWDRIFQIAAWEDLPVVINSNHENRWGKTTFNQPYFSLLEKAIHYTERQNARLFVFNVSTKEELKLIQEARAKSLLIYAETTPQHLFPEAASLCDFLWEALADGTIESIGSGCSFAELSQERLTWRGNTYNFSNPIFFLPLLLTAYHDKKITLENIVRLTRVNLYDIFRLERGDKDFVLVDLKREEKVLRVGENKPKEMILKGWPEYTILQGRVFKSDPNTHHFNHFE